MNSKKKFFFVLVSSFVLSACSHLPVYEQSMQQEVISQTSVLQSRGVQSILTADLETLWSQEFEHYQEDLLLQVSQAISVLAKGGNLANKDLDKLSFYLRIYSSFGPDKDWSIEASQAFNNALLALQAMPGFYQITRNKRGFA